MQNELISVLAKEILFDIKSELQSAPFFVIIFDTTQDVSKKDQLSKFTSKSITTMIECIWLF